MDAVEIGTPAADGSLRRAGYRRLAGTPQSRVLVQAVGLMMYDPARYAGLAQLIREFTLVSVAS